MASDERTAHSRSRWSLAQRLSALFAVLLAAMVGTFGSAAYQQIRDAAADRATERMSSVTREIAVSASRNGAARVAMLQAVARDTRVRNILLDAAGMAPGDAGARPFDVGRQREAGTSAPRELPTSLAALFAARQSPSDSTLLGHQLVSLATERSWGASLGARDSLALARTVEVMQRSDTIARSVLYASGSQVRVWTVVPVRDDDDRLIGALAEHRRLGSSAQTEGLVNRLSGQDAHLYLTSHGSREWASPLGVPVPAPIDSTRGESLPDTGAVRLEAGPDSAIYVAASGVPGTPWRVVMTQSEAAILSAPRAFVNELLLIGAVVLLIGTVGAWWLSRLETQPLQALRHAADTVAAGRYDTVVPPRGSLETAALAGAFNAMSRRISDARNALAEQNAELVRANDARARFLAVMSHELRTPLNAIGGHTEMLAIGVHGPVTDEQLDVLERIGRSKERLLRLVTDILHYTRLEATPLPVSSQPMRVASIVESVCETVSNQFERKGVRLATTPGDALLFADPDRVHQILVNLVTNALQFTERGGEVVISATEAGDWAVLRVSDNGIGISAEQQQSIFDPFVQADSSLTRRTGGAGLGLAIVRQLATAMGGQVHVESTPGHGSTFSVTLPRTPGASAPEGGAPREPSQSARLSSAATGTSQTP